MITIFKNLKITFKMKKRKTINTSKNELRNKIQTDCNKNNIHINIDIFMNLEEIKKMLSKNEKKN